MVIVRFLIPEAKAPVFGQLVLSIGMLAIWTGPTVERSEPPSRFLRFVHAFLVLLVRVELVITLVLLSSIVKLLLFI